MSRLVFSFSNSHVKGGTSLDGRIPREDFSGGGELRVWVEAVNQNGSNKSQPVVFNVEGISESVPQIQTPPQTAVIMISS